MAADPAPSDDFFGLAPVSMWLEDYSALKTQFDRWRAEGMVDLADHLRRHPQETIRCWEKVEVLRINQRTLDMFAARSTAELVQHISIVLHSSDPVEATYPLVQLWNLGPGETFIQTESVNTRLDGQRLDARINAVILPGHEQDWGRVLSTIEDITQLRASQNTLVKLTDQLPGIMFRSHIARDGTQSYLFVSAGVQEMLGLTREQVLRDRLSLLSTLHHDDREDVTRNIVAQLALNAPIDIECRVLHTDGRTIWIQLRSKVESQDEYGTVRVGMMIDITKRKQAEQLTWQQAHFDPLTGLPNRRMLRDRMDREILRCKRDAEQFALLVLDLDNFKEVNDTLGHERGDQLLIQAAQRIRQCVRETDTVARMGGDEFVVLLSELPDSTHLERVLTHTLNTLSLAFQVGGEQVFVSASIGITTYPGDGTDADTLLRNGDQALYAAKNAGRNRFSFFTPALQAATLHRVRLANDLRGALERGELSLVYQPIVHLATGQVHKAEALLRWQHPVRGPVSPAEFIPIAESTGQIVPIGDWVFEQATRQAQRLQAQSGHDFQISINRSPVQFHAAHQPSQAWEDRLQQLNCKGSAIAIEITEGLLLDDSPGIKDQLIAMRASGMEISLDDFGTGYSSLSYLQRYQIDYVKIDQSFVRNLQPDSTGLALCKAIVVMAHVLGLRVVAEGVETATQRELLVDIGCDYAQGYFFAHPMTAPVLENFVADLQAPGTTR